LGAFHIGALGRQWSNLTVADRFPDFFFYWPPLAKRLRFFHHPMKPETGTKHLYSRSVLKLIGCSASEDIHMNAIFSLSILGVAGFVTLATSCSIWLGSLRRI
jgi:hypothetical protein